MQKGSSLRLEGITKSFGATRVLDGVTLDVEPGEFVSLVGASGCGKSTLLRIIAGLEVQDAGQVAIGGRAVDHLGPRQRNIAMVFQSYALYPHMSVHDNIALPLTVSRLSLAERLPLVKYLSPRRPRITRDIGAEVKAVAGQLKLDQLLARKPGQLSGGQRQRVALARAMVRDPSLFLMDEPLSNLDAQLRVHMRDELAELHGRLGATFVYVTHDQVEAMTMSTRVAMMDHGRLEQVGSPRELYERPATLAVARFIGSPAINLLAGTVTEGGRLTVAGVPLPLAVPLGAGSDVTLGVRPEAVRLGGHDGWPGIMGRVRRVEHHGAERLIYVDLEAPLSGSAIVREQSSEDATGVHEVGRPLPLALDPARVHVFDAAGRRMIVSPAGLDGSHRSAADLSRATA